MKIKGYLIDVNNREAKVVEIEKSLDSYYKILQCDTIDIVSRKIGDKWFDIVCDDNGLLMDKPKLSAVDSEGKPQLVGNLFIVKYDGVDDLTSLDDESIKYIEERIMEVTTNLHSEPYPILTELGW